MFLPYWLSAWLPGLVASVAMATPPSPLPSSIPTDTGRSMTFRISGDPETLDWNRSQTALEGLILVNLMEGLVSVSPDLRAMPALAESWTVSPDGKTYTFRLRKDVRWSDGVPFRAKDILFSWKRLLSPMISAPSAYLLFDVVNAEAYYKRQIQDFSQVGIRTPDDYTVQVQLARRVPYWIYIPSMWVTFPLRQDVVEKNAFGWDKPGRMVTLGPYSLASHDIESRLVLRANPLYHGKRRNVSEAIGLVVKDSDQAMSLFEGGKIDVLLDPPATAIAKLQGRPELKSFPALKTIYVGFATKKFPASSPLFRKAIAMAIDPKKVAQTFPGKEPARSLIPRSLGAAWATGGVTFDPAQAKKLLRSAGFDLTRLEISFATRNWEKHLAAAQFVQGELKRNLGLDLVIRPMDNKVFWEQLPLGTNALFHGSWGADYPDPDTFLSVFLPTAGHNFTAWADRRYEDRILAARTKGNTKERETLYREAQRILLEDQAVVVPLYHDSTLALSHSHVRGLNVVPLNNYVYIKDIDLTPAPVPAPPASAPLH